VCGGPTIGHKDSGGQTASPQQAGVVVCHHVVAGSPSQRTGTETHPHGHREPVHRLCGMSPCLSQPRQHANGRNPSQHANAKEIRGFPSPLSLIPLLTLLLFVFILLCCILLYCIQGVNNQQQIRTTHKRQL